MNNVFEYVFEKIEELSPSHALKISKILSKYDDSFFKDATSFWLDYSDWLETQNKTIDFAIDAYLRMLKKMEEEQLYFFRNGKYSNSSFKEVEDAVYLNPNIMTDHMHGLVLAQFLWFEQYQRFLFFKQNLNSNIKNYLEIAGGHGLYVHEALKQLPHTTNFDFVDISKSSMLLAQGINKTKRINYILANIFEYENSYKYDFINAGEILEHLENPLDLLIKIRSLLAIDGVAYITTPINAPMIDHIYLFNSAEEIREMIFKSGMDIIMEKSSVAYNKTEKFAQKHKIPVMYGAFVKSR